MVVDARVFAVNAKRLVAEMRCAPSARVFAAKHLPLDRCVATVTGLSSVDTNGRCMAWLLAHMSLLQIEKPLVDQVAVRPLSRPC